MWGLCWEPPIHMDAIPQQTLMHYTKNVQTYTKHIQRIYKHYRKNVQIILKVVCTLLNYFGFIYGLEKMHMSQKYYCSWSYKNYLGKWILITSELVKGKSKGVEFGESVVGGNCCGFCWSEMHFHWKWKWAFKVESESEIA